jgi:YVTN family beta-propeller protein
MSPDGAQLYVSTYNGQLTIVDRAQRTIVKTLTLGGTPSRVAFDKPGKTAFVANENDWVDVIK